MRKLLLIAATLGTLAWFADEAQAQRRWMGRGFYSAPVVTYSSWSYPTYSTWGYSPVYSYSSPVYYGVPSYSYVSPSYYSSSYYSPSYVSPSYYGSPYWSSYQSGWIPGGSYSAGYYSPGFSVNRYGTSIGGMYVPFR
jgi:hypothetical protein